MPRNRLIRNTKAAEHIGIKIVFAYQQLMYVFKEHATLSTLNDAMVVRARNSDNFRNTKSHDGSFIRTLELGRVIN